MACVVSAILYFAINSESFDFSSLMGNSAAKGDFSILVDGKKTSIISLSYNEKKQLYVDDAIAKQGITWSSKSSNIVSVDKNGKITARKKNVGMTEIYATMKNGKKGILTVKVYPSGDYTDDFRNFKI